jgi:hypothetical protein
MKIDGFKSSSSSSSTPSTAESSSISRNLSNAGDMSTNDDYDSESSSCETESEDEADNEDEEEGGPNLDESASVVDEGERYSFIEPTALSSSAETANQRTIIYGQCRIVEVGEKTLFLRSDFGKDSTGAAGSGLRRSNDLASGALPVIQFDDLILFDLRANAECLTAVTKDEYLDGRIIDFDVDLDFIDGCATGFLIWKYFSGEGKAAGFEGSSVISWGGGWLTRAKIPKAGPTLNIFQLGFRQVVSNGLASFWVHRSELNDLIQELERLGHRFLRLADEKTRHLKSDGKVSKRRTNVSAFKKSGESIPQHALYGSFKVCSMMYVKCVGMKKSFFSGNALLGLEWLKENKDAVKSLGEKLIVMRRRHQRSIDEYDILNPSYRSREIGAFGDEGSESQGRRINAVIILNDTINLYENCRLSGVDIAFTFRNGVNEDGKTRMILASKKGGKIDGCKSTIYSCYSDTKELGSANVEFVGKKLKDAIHTETSSKLALYARRLTQYSMFVHAYGHIVDNLRFKGDLRPTKVGEKQAIPNSGVASRLALAYPEICYEALVNKEVTQNKVANRLEYKCFVESSVDVEFLIEGVFDTIVYFSKDPLQATANVMDIVGVKLTVSQTIDDWEQMLGRGISEPSSEHQIELNTPSPPPSPLLS